MKKSNVIVLGLLALISVFLLWLWYFLGLNCVDEPLDLIVSIIWWIVIITAIIVITKVERIRRQHIRTVYVGDHALFNSEKGLVALEGFGLQNMNVAIASILKNLKYNFRREDFPEKENFEARYFVRTRKFDVADKQSAGSPVADTQAPTEMVKPQVGQKTWTGEVFIVKTKEERPFNTPEELASILATLR